VDHGVTLEESLLFISKASAATFVSEVLILFFALPVLSHSGGGGYSFDRADRTSVARDPLCVVRAKATEVIQNMKSVENFKPK